MENKLKNFVAIGCASLKFLLSVVAVNAMEGYIKFGEKEPTEQVQKENTKYNLPNELTFEAGVAAQYKVPEARYSLRENTIREKIKFEEHLFNNPKILKNNSLVKKLISGPFAINGLNVFFDAMKTLDKDYNDEGLPQVSLEKKGVNYSLLLLIPAIQAWRDLKNEKYPAKKSLLSKTEIWATLIEDGAIFGLRYNF